MNQFLGILKSPTALIVVEGHVDLLGSKPDRRVEVEVTGTPLST